MHSWCLPRASLRNHRAVIGAVSSTRALVHVAHAALSLLWRSSGVAMALV